MTRSLPLTLDTSSAALMVRGTTQPAIPKSHEEMEEGHQQINEVIHHDHPASVDNIPAETETEEKPHITTSPHHHTKINSILHNELLDQLHQQRHAAIRGKGGDSPAALDDDLLALYSSRKEITMGICAAFSVFLIIVLVFVVRVHRSRTPAMDKETLIDNEADVGFLPPPSPSLPLPPMSSFMDSETQTTVHV